MYPDCNEIMKLAPEYHIIPVCKEIYADVITPITLFEKDRSGKQKILSAGKCGRWRKIGEDIHSLDLIRSCVLHAIPIK